MRFSTTTAVYEKIYIMAALVIFNGAFFYSFRERGATAMDLSEGDTYMQIIFACIYAIMLLLIAPRAKEVYLSIKNMKWLWIVALLTLLSTTWSFDEDRTLRRSLGLFTTTLFGVYFGTVLNLRQQFRLIAITLTFLLISSLLISLFLPQYGVMDGLHYGRWSGVYVHKNLLGRVAGLGTVFFPFYAIRNRTFRLPSIGLTLLSVFLLYMAESATSYIVVIILVGCILLYQFVKTQQNFVMVMTPYIFGLLVAVLFFGFGLIELFFGFFERDLTLTGRTNLWPFVIEMIQRRPWIGYGYSGFWLGENGPSYEIWRWSWDTPHAHNGFLDIALDIGLVGLALVLFGFFRSYAQAYIFYKNAKSFNASWPIIYMTFILLNNLTESVILKTNDMYWILYIAAATSVCNMLAQQKLQREAIQSSNEEYLLYLNTDGLHSLPTTATNTLQPVNLMMPGSVVYEH